ncbi:MAG TPA: hypothetical protein VMM56_09435, partial [Planctomycetaceae bacterium]|nr:hypothetical protein [Planctomycetaceae bacterium]
MTSKRMLLTVAMVAGFALIAGNASTAEAGRRGGYHRGYGHQGHYGNHGQWGNWGGRGGHYDWHDTS